MDTQVVEEQIKQIWVERGNKSIDEMDEKELSVTYHELKKKYGDMDLDYELPPSLTNNDDNEQLLFQQFATVLMDKIGDMELEDYYPDLWQQMKSKGLRRRDVVDIIRDEQDRHVENRFVEVSEIDNYMFNLIANENQEVLIRDKTTKRIYTAGEATCQFYLLANLLELVCRYAPRQDVVNVLTGDEQYFCYGNTQRDAEEIFDGVRDIMLLLDERKNVISDDRNKEIDDICIAFGYKFDDCVHFILGTECVEEKEQ